MKIKFIKKCIVSLIILLLISQPILAISINVNLNESINKINNSIDEVDYLGNLMNKICTFGSIPSLSVCIITNNEIIWSNSYGLKNIEKNEKSSINTSYLVASISKTVTTTALLQLYEQGLLQLDENVNNYLDFELINPYYPKEEITFEMLLTHTSSLDIEPNWFYSVNYSSYDIPPLKNWIKSYFYENDEPREDIWMNRKPGSTFKYSNLGFCVIGYLVEKISGKNLNDYCKENIFQPLEMFNTSFNLSDFELDNVATPHMLAYRNLRGESLDIYLPLPHYSVIPYPAYGLRTTVEDLSKFLIAHTNDGKYKDFQLLNKTTIELMHKSYVSFGKLKNKLSYGYGWINYGKIPKKEGHEGSLFGYSSFMKHIKINDKSIIFFTNRELSIDFYGRFALKMIEKILVLKSFI